MSSPIRTRYAVACQKHGVESKNWSGRQVLISVSSLTSKGQRKTVGCPLCKAESK